MDPFDATGGAGSNWGQNLMAFGLATMAAGAQPGAKLLGSVGQGGLAAMQASRENATAAANTNYYNAETKSKNLANQISLTQINYQRQLMGQPPLDNSGNPTQTAQSSLTGSSPLDPNSASSADPLAPSATPPSNTSGMTHQPTAGSSVMTPSTYASSTGATPSGTAYSPTDINAMLSGIYRGQITPTAEMARVVAPTAAAMNLPIAADLQKLAYGGLVAGEEAKAKVPYTFSDVRQGGSLFQGGKLVAQGAMPAVAADGTPYTIPAHDMNGAAATGATASTDATASAMPNAQANVTPTSTDNNGLGSSAPLGIRNNNMLNIRPNPQIKWAGQTGENSGYLTFDSPDSGIRAAALNLRSYGQRGINTPATIAATWAPAGDGKNDPVAYGKQLATILGTQPNTPLNLQDPAQVAATIHGMGLIENAGKVPYSVPQIQGSVQLAFHPGATPAPQVAPQAAAPATGGGVAGPAVAGNGIPAGAIQTGIGPTQEGYAKERGTDLAKKQGEWDTQAQGAIESNYSLDNMRNESQSWRMGKWADSEQQARTYLQGFAGVIGADKTQFDQPLGDRQAFDKTAGQLIRQSVRETSSRAAFQEFEMIRKQLPSAEMSNGGFNTVVDQMQATNDYKIARQTAAQSWLNQTDANGNKIHNSIDGFESDFNKNVTPATFLINRMSPQDLQTMRTNLLKQNNGQQVINNLMGHVAYAQQNGLFEQ